MHTFITRDRFTYAAKVILLGLILGLGIQFLYAWTAPTGTAPAGNVFGPITATDATDQPQTRASALGVMAPLKVWNATGQNNYVVTPKICLNNDQADTAGTCISDWSELGGSCTPISQTNDVRGVRSTANIMYRNETGDTLTWTIGVGAGTGYGGWPQYGPEGTINNAGNTEHHFIDNGTLYTLDIPPGHYYGMSSHGDPRYATVNTWNETTITCVGGGGGTGDNLGNQIANATDGLNMSDTTIFNLADPISDQDAATKGYVDTAVAGAGVGSGAGGSVKAWFSWSTGGLLDSGGVTSVTRISGSYLAVTLSSPMSSSNYAVICNGSINGDNTPGTELQMRGYNKTTTTFNVRAAHGGGADPIGYADCMVYGN